MYGKQWEVFNRIRITIGANDRSSASFVHPPGMGDAAERALTELVRKTDSLEGLEERLLHVLAVREEEALRERSLKFLGMSVWGESYGIALSMAVGERRGRASAKARPPGSAIGAASPRHDHPESNELKNFGDA